MNRIERNARITDFILEWAKSGKTIDCLNEEFHDEFSNLFGGSRKQYIWGANTNNTAMAWVKKLYDQGLLERALVPLSGAGPEFPKWVFGYWSRKHG